eukprot:scaffold17342_cov130-Isochrysis_galbana.AAC.12
MSPSTWSASCLSRPAAIRPTVARPADQRRELAVLGSRSTIYNKLDQFSMRAGMTAEATSAEFLPL